MKRGTPYFAGLTKTKLIETIQAELTPYAFGLEFESPLISDLIAAKHYYCSKKGIKPTRFRKLFRAGAIYGFEGFFNEHGWHEVSWRQCINPRDEHDWLKRAIRDAVQPIVSRYKSLNTICEICSIVPSEEVDHVDPEFDTIATEAIATLSSQQIEAIFKEFDWLSKEPFGLPESNPAIQYVLKAHITAQLRAVCKPCHSKSSKERRNAK